MKTSTDQTLRDAMPPGRTTSSLWDTGFVRVVSALIGASALLAPMLTGSLIQTSARGAEGPLIPETWLEPSWSLAVAVVAFYQLPSALLAGLVAHLLTAMPRAQARRRWLTLTSMGASPQHLVRATAKAAALTAAITASTLVLTFELGRGVWILVHAHGTPNLSRSLSLDAWTLVAELIAISISISAAAATGALFAFRVTRYPNHGSLLGKDSSLRTPLNLASTQRRRWRVVLWALAITGVTSSAAVLAWWRFFSIPYNPANSATSANGYESPPLVQMSASLMLVALAGFLTLIAVEMSGLALRMAARGLHRSRKHLFVAVEHSLRSTQGMQRAAVAVVVLAVGFIAVSMNSSHLHDARLSVQGQSFRFDVVVFAPGILGNSGLEPGYASATLPAELIATLNSDHQLETVPFGLLVSDPVAYDTSSTSPQQRQSQVALPIFKKVDLSSSDLEAWRLSGIAGSTVVTDSLVWPSIGGWLDRLGPATLTVNAEPFTVINTSSLPIPLADSKWMISNFGEHGIAGIGLYQSESSDLTTAEFAAYVSKAIEDSKAQGVGVFFNDERPIWNEPEDGVTSSVVLAVIVSSFGLTILVGQAVVLSRRRLRDLATMSALGLRSRALHIAPAMEIGLLTLSATASATVVGIVASSVAELPNLWDRRAHVDATNIAWNLWWNLGHSLWIPMLIGCVCLAVLTSLIGAFVAGRWSARTPVAQLREAIKEGAL